MRSKCFISAFFLILPFPFAHAAPIHTAAESNDTQKIRDLVADGADINEVDFVSGSPLHIAAVRGHVDLVKFLLNSGADVDIEEFGKSDTPLHWAALGGHASIIELLVTAGSDIDATNDYQNTPLHIATDSANAEAALKLIHLGANLSARNQKGNSAMHLAGVSKLFNVVDLLKERGAQNPPPENIGPLLASASVSRGEELFLAKCNRCHALPIEDIDDEGPSLWNVVGRDQAASERFDYSASFRRLGQVWSYENLNHLLSDSRNYVPGNSMSKGDAMMISEEQDRADIIAFLRMQSDEPVPLP